MWLEHCGKTRQSRRRVAVIGREKQATAGGLHHPGISQLALIYLELRHTTVPVPLSKHTHPLSLCRLSLQHCMLKHTLTRPSQLQHSQQHLPPSCLRYTPCRTIRSTMSFER